MGEAKHKSCATKNRTILGPFKKYVLRICMSHTELSHKLKLKSLGAMECQALCDISIFGGQSNA